MSPRRLIAAAGAAGAIALTGGCGSDSSGTGPVAEPAPTGPPIATAPSATAPPTDATGPATNQAPPPNTGTSPESGAGQGDEEPVRVPAKFAFTPGGVKPRTISVPAFLAVTISVISADGLSHEVELEARGKKRIELAAGATAVLNLSGLRAGRYALREHGRTVATLVAGGEPGT
jgi:hypothetical protein